MTDQLAFPTGRTPHRRTGRLRRGLDAALATMTDDPPSPALVALARVAADVADGAAARALHYTDRGEDPPYALTVSIPKLLEHYASTLAALIESGGDRDPFDRLARELSAAMGDPAQP